jgi:hypothetical protein
MRRQKVQVHRIQRQQGGYEGPAAGPVQDPWSGEPASQPTQRPPQGSQPQRGTWQRSGQPVQPTPQNYGQQPQFPDEPPFFHRTPDLAV